MTRILGSLALFAILFTIQSCKETTVLGTDLIPKVDNINTFATDTITMVAKNVAYDSVITSGNNSSTEYFALGTIGGDANGDNALGKTVASFALQLRQPKLGLAYPTDVIIDSIVFTAPFKRAYGDTITGGNQTFQVYRITESPNKDSNYYINKSWDYNNANLLGSAAFNFSKMDSLTIEGVKQGPQIRIPLDTNFARTLVNLKDTAEYATYVKFLAWFKGLYITPSDTNNGNMLGYFQMAKANMQLYSRSKNLADNTKMDTIVYTYDLDPTTCVHHNKIIRNHYQNNPLIASHIPTTAAKGDSLLFVQSDGGSSIELTFPYLDAFPNAIINKAELEFTLVGSGNAMKDSLYRPIILLRATGISDQNVDYLLSDDYVQTTSGITKIVNDGYRKNETVNSNTVVKYRLTLTKTFQKAISSHNKTLKIRIIGLNGYLGSGRSVLGGTNRISQKAKINLIFTKIK